MTTQINETGGKHVSSDDTAVSECHCGQLELLEAGTECNVHLCQLCGKWVADAAEYYKFNSGADVLSK